MATRWYYSHEHTYFNHLDIETMEMSGRIDLRDQAHGQEVFEYYKAQGISVVVWKQEDPVVVAEFCSPAGPQNWPAFLPRAADNSSGE